MINIDELLHNADWPKRTDDRLAALRVAEFDEAKHPRDEQGQFTDAGGGPREDASRLSAKQVDALQNYAAGSEEINAALRSGRGVSKFDEKNDTVGNLDRAIAKQRPLTSGMTLYRVVEKDVTFKDEYTDKAFVSTTKSPSAIEGMLEDAGFDPNDVVLLRLTIDDDVRGLDVNKHLPRDRNFFSNQKEVLLERGLTFSYISPARDAIEGMPTHNVRVSNYKRRSASRRETRLHAIADTFTPKFEVAVRAAFALGRRAIGRSKDADKAVKAIRKSLEGTLPKLLRRMYAAGGEATAGALRTSEAFRAAKRADFKPKRRGPISFAFDAASEEAISWADKHAAELIDGISETSRQAINDAVAESLEEGTDPYEAILEAVGDEARARKIAHHEPMLAVHEGQREAWRQAEEDGLLTGRERPVWIVTGDDKVCPICQGLEDKTRALDGEYSFDGEEYAGPPAHVGCRCTEGLTA